MAVIQIYVVLSTSSPIVYRPVSRRDCILSLTRGGFLFGLRISRSMVTNPYALPSIIAFALLLFLGLIVLLQNPGSRTSRLLCAICLTYGLSVGSAGMLHLSTNEVLAIFWNKWPYIFGLPNLVLIMEFALYTSDRPKRLKDTFIGLAVHRWIIYVILGASWIALLSSDWILAPPHFTPPPVGSTNTAL